MHQRFILGGLLMAILAAAFCWWISCRISRPLEGLRQGVRRYAQGDFSSRLPVPASEEIAELVEAANHMAFQLERRITTVVSQRNELDAVFSGMDEGVLPIDMEDHLIRLNLLAAELLQVDMNDSVGKTVHEVIRDTGLLVFVKEVVDRQEPVERDLVLRLDGEGQQLRLSGTFLRGDSGDPIGVLIILNNLTRIRQLENVRREFVSNVSHELKTPITSIKGFVETLLDGAKDNPDDAERFLNIIAKQANRLNAIIEDILSLSRLEQSEETDEIAMNNTNLEDVILSAIQSCEPKSAEKSIAVTFSDSSGTAAIVNRNLIEQALINLIDNAIKYSDPRQSVQVEVCRDHSESILSVRDHGSGIEQEHLSRLFERFYRVDMARSRTLGGTGLGLTIIKYIVKVHSGEVSVQSTPG